MHPHDFTIRADQPTGSHSHPIRILHLLDADATQAAHDEALTLQRAASDRSSPSATDCAVHTIGRGADYRNPLLALYQLRREPNIQVIQVYALRTLKIALATGKQVIYRPDQPANANEAHHLRRLMRWRAFRIAAPTQTALNGLLHHGLPAGQCTLIHPCPMPAGPPVSKDVNLRTALGLRDQDFVILAAGETTASANHELAIWATSILGELQDHYKLLLWGRGDEIHKPINLAGNMHCLKSIRTAEQQLGKAIDHNLLFSAADAIAVTSLRQPSAWWLASSIRSGLPIISTQTATTNEVLTNRQSAVLLPENTACSLAQQVMELHADTGLQQHLSQGARTTAQQLFSPEQYSVQWNQFY